MSAHDTAGQPGEDRAARLVAVIQHDIIWEDRDANLARLREPIADAAGQGARLVVLTEMFATGFSPNTAGIAEPTEGPTTEFLLEQARRHGIWLVGSVCCSVAGAELPGNVAMVVSPLGEVHRYVKRHLFSYAGEHTRITAGTETLTVDIGGLRTSVFICYDLRFAEDFWTLGPSSDAYVVVANWPRSRIAHWRALLVARAIENQAWVIGSNRVGEGGGIDYTGDSLIVDPLGRIVADGAGGAEEVLLAEVSVEEVSEVRGRYPFVSDRI